MQKLLISFLFILTSLKASGNDPLLPTTKETIPYIRNLEAQKESVVCVHAFLRSYTSLKPIGRVLEGENYDVFLWNYETRKFTLEDHACNLVKLLKKIAELKPGIPINFVTHSIGGVIVRVALSKPDCPQEAKIGKAVLMAPPNAGSELARKYRCVGAVQFVFGGKLGRQLLTYSPEQMLAVAQMPPTLDVLVISGFKKSRFIPFKLPSENDGKVCVKETVLKTKYQHALLNVNHTYIITNRESLDLMKDFIKSKETLNRSVIRYNDENKDKPEIHVIHCFASKPSIVIGFPKNKKP